jgi:hypothetical protein
VIKHGAPQGALLAKEILTMKNKDETLNTPAGNKDQLSQQDIKSGVKNFAEGDQPHAALETADGKNNGAEPAVFQKMRKAQT